MPFVRRRVPSVLVGKPDNNRTFGGGKPIDVLTRMFETRVLLVFRTENYDGCIRLRLFAGLEWQK